MFCPTAASNLFERLPHQFINRNAKDSSPLPQPLIKRVTILFMLSGSLGENREGMRSCNRPRLPATERVSNTLPVPVALF